MGRKLDIKEVSVKDLFILYIFNGSFNFSYSGGLDWDCFLNGSMLDFGCNIDFGSGIGFNGGVICVELWVYGGVSVLVVLWDFDLSFYGNFCDYECYVLDDFLWEVIGVYWIGLLYYNGSDLSFLLLGVGGYVCKYYWLVFVVELEVVIVKVMFWVDMVWFKLLVGLGYLDLRNEISWWLKVDEYGFDLKYLDDEEEWMLIICDVDVKECIDVV